MPYFQSPTQNPPSQFSNYGGGIPTRSSGNLLHGSGRPPRRGIGLLRGGGGPLGKGGPPRGSGPPSGGRPLKGDGSGFPIGGIGVPFGAP